MSVKEKDGVVIAGAKWTTITILTLTFVHTNWIGDSIKKLHASPFKFDCFTMRLWHMPAGGSAKQIYHDIFVPLLLIPM